MFIVDLVGFVHTNSVQACNTHPARKTLVGLVQLQYFLNLNLHCGSASPLEGGRVVGFPRQVRPRESM